MNTACKKHVICWYLSEVSAVKDAVYQHVSQRSMMSEASGEMMLLNNMQVVCEYGFATVSTASA